MKIRGVRGREKNLKIVSILWLYSRGESIEFPRQKKQCNEWKKGFERVRGKRKKEEVNEKRVNYRPFVRRRRHQCSLMLFFRHRWRRIKSFSSPVFIFKFYVHTLSIYLLHIMPLWSWATKQREQRSKVKKGSDSFC